MLLTYLGRSCPLKPKCICCKDIIRLWLLGPNSSPVKLAEGFWSSGSGLEVKGHCFICFFLSFFNVLLPHFDATSTALSHRERDQSEMTCSPEQVSQAHRFCRLCWLGWIHWFRYLTNNTQYDTLLNFTRRCYCSAVEQKLHIIGNAPVMRNDLIQN